VADDRDRIQEIRERRKKEAIGAADPSRVAESQGMRSRTQKGAEAIGRAKGAEGIETGGVGGGTPSPWLFDRVTLSLEAQIAMIEMRATQRLTLADIGYTNRQQMINMKPGVFLRNEPTGCYRLVYNNRM
jgi:hypothetical protein